LTNRGSQLLLFGCEEEEEEKNDRERERRKKIPSAIERKEDLSLHSV
jgi:hypothetical protein